ncbi:single-stranded DNA-binding protein [Streptomyces smyrnaeus]|uniref:single-stranded DNA-binding protein n=1 Tax=Streptomyces smyrnaeus TaxID=1387713 RepID=UPI0033D6313E
MERGPARLPEVDVSQVPNAITVTGTVTGEPELRFTRRKTPVARFLMRSAERRWNAATHKWEEQPPLQYVCTVWRRYAEHAAETLTDGVRVVVTGRLTGTQDGVLHVSVEDIGISLFDRIAYTETTIPGALEPRPRPAPAAPAPSPVAEARTRRRDWWEQPPRPDAWHTCPSG